jgi:thioredoxin-related protein
MKKLAFLGLLSLVTINFLFAEEYISDEYFEEVAAQAEIVYESIESLPIAKTVEEQAREEEIVVSSNIEPTLEMIEEVDEKLVPPIVNEEKQTIQANTYLNALKQARNESKVVMLTIRSTDCKYCDKMEAGTLSDESVKEALLANFITVHYNQDLEPLPLNLQNGATPMFIFVNTNEDILNMYPGIRTPDEFKEVLEQILAM